MGRARRRCAHGNRTPPVSWGGGPPADLVAGADLLTTATAVWADREAGRTASGAPGGDDGWGSGFNDHGGSLRPQQQQCDSVLARELPARTAAAVGGTLRIAHHLVGQPAAAATFAPRGAAVVPGVSPRPRRCQLQTGGQATGVGCERHHLLDGRPCHRTQRSRDRTSQSQLRAPSQARRPRCSRWSTHEPCAHRAG
jgi:hypothetical protein